MSENENWATQAVEDAGLEAFDLDTEGVDVEKIGSRLSVDKVGKYHLECARVTKKLETVNDNGGQASPHLGLTCVVLQTVAGQSPEGAVYFHRLPLRGAGGGPLVDWQLNSLLSFLEGIGLLKKVEGKLIDPKTNSTRIDMASLPERLEGWQFVGDLKLNKSKDPQYEDRIELGFGRGAFPIDAKEVLTVPRSIEAIKIIKPVQGVDVPKLLAALAGAIGVSGAGGAKPGTTKPATPPAAKDGKPATSKPAATTPAATKPVSTPAVKAAASDVDDL